MTVTHLIAAERGYLSVQDKIQAGVVKMYDGSSLTKFQNIFYRIYKGEIEVKPTDIIAIDALSMLNTRVRQDMVMELAPSREVNLWEHRNKMTASQRHYGETADMLLRTLLMYFSLVDEKRCRCVVLSAIEREREDPMSGGVEKLGMDLNPALLNPLVQQCDVIGRITRSEDAVTGPGEGILNEEVTYPPGTFFLRLRSSQRVAAGARSFPGINVPDVMPSPSLPKLLDGVYRGIDVPIIAVFGPPKNGKTTFLCSGSPLPDAVAQPPAAPEHKEMVQHA